MCMQAQQTNQQQQKKRNRKTTDQKHRMARKERLDANCVGRKWKMEKKTAKSEQRTKNVCWHYNAMVAYAELHTHSWHEYCFWMSFFQFCQQAKIGKLRIYAHIQEELTGSRFFPGTNYFSHLPSAFSFSTDQLFSEHNSSGKKQFRSACEATLTECEFNCMRAKPVAYTLAALRPFLCASQGAWDFWN